MERLSFEKDFCVINDKGFGECYSRQADTIEEAAGIMDEWRKGNSGSFRIQTAEGEFVAGDEPAPTPNWW